MSYKKMVVIFLDILGSKSFTNFDTKFEIHNLFHTEAKLNEKRQENIAHVIYERKIFTFSDCAYIFYYYKDGIEESRKNDANLGFIAIHNTNLSILKFLYNGYFIRGGISFGDAYFDEHSFFGPAVEQAFHIESKEAKYPRIMIDNKFGKLIYDFDHLPKDINSISLLKEIPYMIEKEENQYYVNILRQLQVVGTQSLNDVIFTLEEVKSNAIKKALSEIERCKNDEVSKKLLWLIDYLNSKQNLLLPEFREKTFSAITKNI